MSYKFLGMKPRKHQLETIKFYLTNKKCYNFSALGSGKTAASLWASDMLLEAGKIKRVLIVCPLSIMQAVWAREIRKVLPNRSYSIVHGPRDKRLAAMQSDANYHITNVDALRTYWEDLLQIGYQVIILDEVDNFKNPSSKRSKGMYKLSTRAKGVWGLTGTPMGNNPLEAFGIAKVVNPDNMPTKYVTRFRQMTMVQYGQYTWVPNEQAETVVHKMLQPAIAYKLENCVDIPDIIYEYREFEMEGKQKKYYKEMYNHQLIEAKEGLIIASTAGVKYNKLLQISAGAVYNENGETVVMPMKEKINEVLHVQKEVGKLIIFSQFINIIKHLETVLPDSIAVFGETRNRVDRLEDFKNGKYNILIAQPRVLAHGVNLQYCNTIIFWSPVLGNSYYRQAIGRIRRSGQKNKQVIINFVTSPAEKKLYKMLREKEISSRLLMEMFYK